MRTRFLVSHYPLSNRALFATTIVLNDISTAPNAGLSRMPKLYSTPAASGIAIALMSSMRRQGKVPLNDNVIFAGDSYPLLPVAAT